MLNNENLKEKLLEKTNSGKPRIPRVLRNCTEIKNELGENYTVDRFLEISKEFSQKYYDAETVRRAKNEIRNFIFLINEMLKNTNEFALENFKKKFKKTNYPAYAKMTEICGIENVSKFTTRMDSLRLIYLKWYASKGYYRKSLHNTFIRELNLQKDFLEDFSQNVLESEAEYFILSILFYDIPAEDRRYVHGAYIY